VCVCEIIGLHVIKEESETEGECVTQGPPNGTHTHAFFPRIVSYAHHSMHLFEKNIRL